MAVSNQVMNHPGNNLINMDQNTLTVLKETLYPGAKDASIMMVLNYCKARKIISFKAGTSCPDEC